MTTASVPGKLILLGEHAAVYGRPALVAAVGLRLSATVTGSAGSADSADRDVRIRLGDLVDATRPWSEILAHAETARAAWERYAADPGPETFAALAGPARESGPLHLLKIALGEAERVASRNSPASPRPPSPLELAVESEIPIGSGFGSSAAAAVGVVLAYLEHRGVETDPGLLHRVSLEVERRQHGSPSGVDNATVIQGGILEARRTEDGVAFEPVTVRSPLLGSVRVFGTGSPAEGTGTVVAAVRALRDREPERVEAALDRLAELTARLRRELESTTERPDEALAIFREAEARLEELGVVPAPVRELVRRVEAAGGAAKISGAGALTCPGAGHGAGNLMIYHPEPERLAEWPFLAGLERYDVELGVPGARFDAYTERVSP
jgi:mevalonate kinase